MLGSCKFKIWLLQINNIHLLSGFIVGITGHMQSWLVFAYDLSLRVRDIFFKRFSTLEALLETIQQRKGQ